EPHHVGPARHQVPGAAVEPGGVHADEDLLVLDLRDRDLPEVEPVGVPVAVLDDRPHRVGRRGGRLVLSLVVAVGAHGRVRSWWGAPRLAVLSTGTVPY